MSESIQNHRPAPASCATIDPDAARRTFIRRAAELYDRPVDVDLAELDGCDDAAALLLAFPWMDDAELLEALWALGRHLAGDDV